MGATRIFSTRVEREKLKCHKGKERKLMRVCQLKFGKASW